MRARVVTIPVTSQKAMDSSAQRASSRGDRSMRHTHTPQLHRRRNISYLSTLLVLGCMAMSVARAEVIYQEGFSAGLGQFTATGSVSTTTGAARMRGSLGSDDGTITSAPISTLGFTDISLSFDRTPSGL